MSELLSRRVTLGFYDPESESWKRLWRWTLSGDDGPFDRAKVEEAVKRYRDLLDRKREHPKITDDTPIRVSIYESRRYNTAVPDGSGNREVERVDVDIKTRTEVAPPKTIKEHEELRAFA